MPVRTDEATPPTPPTPPRPAEDESGGLTLGRLKQLTNVVAPTTLVTSLLFYFGYVGTRSRFEYFGVYLDMTDLSNQRLLLYGLEVIYVPAALGFLAVLFAATFHAGIAWLLDVRKSDTAILIIGPGAVLLGVLVIGRALVGILVTSVYDREILGTTPLALALGPIAAAYGIWICARRARRTVGRSDRARLIQWYDSASMARLRRAGVICVVGLAVAGLFWAVNVFAWASGDARAYKDALGLPEQPEVVLDSGERLTDIPAGVTESPLPARQSTFRYRYRGLRLLLASGDRLFLVPQHWTAKGRTLVVPYDGHVRIQLIPKPGGERA
jgi:hypothetical protein